jgi:siroheme synthase-like protein
MVESGKVEWVNRQYKKGDLYGAFLAIAATNNRRVNLRVSIEATKCKTILNVIDDTPLCSFIAPSIINKGDVTVAISTGGTSPALARKLRHLLDNSPQLEYACLSQIMGQARKLISKKQISVSPNHWQKCITQDLLDLVKSGNQQQALDILMERLISQGSPIV